MNTEIPAEKIAKAKLQAHQIRTVIELAGAIGANGTEGALLVLDDYARSLEEGLEQARRTIVRSFFSYGTSFTRITVGGKTERTGFRCEPWGNSSPANDWKNYADSVQRIVSRLQGVVIENRPASELLSRYDSEDTLFYLDPPYVLGSRASTRNGRGRGYRHDMTDAEHLELAAALQGVKGTVFISGYPSALYDEKLYTADEGWARCSVQSYSVNAIHKTEVLWVKYSAKHASEMGSLFQGLKEEVA